MTRSELSGGSVEALDRSSRVSKRGSPLPRATSPGRCLSSRERVEKCEECLKSSWREMAEHLVVYIIWSLPATHLRALIADVSSTIVKDSLKERHSEVPKVHTGRLTASSMTPKVRVRTVATAVIVQRSGDLVRNVSGVGDVSITDLQYWQWNRVNIAPLFVLFGTTLLRSV